MDDLISRQSAIEALKQQAETMSEWSNRYAEQRKGVLTAVNIVEDLPPAQLGTNLAEVGTDTISRQELQDKFEQWQKTEDYSNDEWNLLVDVLSVIKSMPPAQPERIIHCKDCEWWTKQEHSPQGICALSGMYPSGGWFCGNARMREVTT